MHLRQQIRQKVIEKLTGLTTTGQKVLSSRVFSLPQQALPALSVYTKEESSEYISLTIPRTIQRQLMVSVEIFVAANVNSDNTIDTISEEIEAAMTDDITLDGLCKDVIIDSFDSDFDGEGEVPVARATINIAITYFNEEGRPQTAK